MYLFHFHFQALWTLSAVQLIILLDCLVIANKLPSHSNAKDAKDGNNGMVIAPPKNYWSQRLCRDTHKEFLQMFQVLFTENGPLCPDPNQNSNTILKDNSVRPPLRNDRLSRSKRYDEGQKTRKELSGHSIGALSSSYPVEGLKLKRTRGCRRGNSTHFCQYKIDESTCFLRSTGDPREKEMDEDGQISDDLVSMDTLSENNDKPSLTKVWGYGIISCTAVIIFARLGLLFFPLLRKDLYERLIITMVGLAAGTLTGSSIFHLLPKAFSLDEKYDSQKYLNRCFIIAGGLWLFLVVERLLKIAFHYNERKITKKRMRNVSNVLASPSFKEQENVISVICRDLESNVSTLGSPTNDRNESSCDQSARSKSHANDIEKSQPDFKSESGNELETWKSADKYRLNSNELQLQPIKFQESSLSQVSTEAWMVIAGDAFLDFVDGLSIGTAFQDSILTGFSISLGILLEEIPHELGEFAVLINAGLSFREALLFKFLASCTTYLGLCVGIWLGGVEAGHYVFALAAGMFLYIALADMIPELNEAGMKSTRSSVRKGLRVLVMQNIGLLLGMGVIYLMARYEDFFKQL